MVDDMMEGLSQDNQRQGHDPQSSFLEFPISILDDTNMSTTDKVLPFTPTDEKFPLIDQSDTNPETPRESVLGDDSLDYLDDFSALLALPMTIPSPFTSSVNQVPNGRGRPP
ncbi:hypothetical protein MMC22_009351 [Lobaria immixta]|nr:hypothetical protein [Lobaria immixta]